MNKRSFIIKIKWDSNYRRIEWDSHIKDKTVMIASYLDNGDTSLYWERPPLYYPWMAFFILPLDFITGNRIRSPFSGVMWKEGSAAINLSHQPHGAPVPCPIMHHFVTEMCTYVHISVTKWCIVGYLSDALWDWRNGSVCHWSCLTHWWHFEMHFPEWKLFEFSSKVSPKYVPTKCSIDNMSALVHIMAWWCTGDKSLYKLQVI